MFTPYVKKGNEVGFKQWFSTYIAIVTSSALEQGLDDVPLYSLLDPLEPEIYMFGVLVEDRIMSNVNSRLIITENFNGRHITNA